MVVYGAIALIKNKTDSYSKFVLKVNSKLYVFRCVCFSFIYLKKRQKENPLKLFKDIFEQFTEDCIIQAE